MTLISSPVRRTAALLAAGAFALSGCGGDDAGSANTCDGVADDFIELLQTVVDEANELSLADLANMEEEPAFLTALEADGEAIAARAEELDCDEAVVLERLDEIETEPGSFGEIIIEGIKSEGLS